MKEQPADRIKLDFEQARAKHLLFKTRLSSILFGAEINEAPVLSQYECTVGKWIYGHALTDYAHIPEMHQLEQVHADLHITARTLVEKYKKGEVAAARGGLEGFEKIADQLVALLSAVEAKVIETPPLQILNEAYPNELAVNLQELRELQQLNQDLGRRIREQSKELYEAKERFELVAKATQDAVWDWNLTNDNIWWNESFKTLFGYKDDEIEPGIESWHSKVHPDDKEKVTASLLKVIDNGGSQWAGEYRFRKADDTFATVYDRAYVLYNERGKPHRVVGSIIDITQRKATENALTESEGNFRRMILQAPVAICIFSGQGYVVEIVNHLMEKMLERKAADILGKSFFEGMPEFGTKGFEAILKGIKNNETAFTGVEREFELPREGKLQKVYVTFIYEPIYNANKSISGIMLLATDVTDQVLSMQKLEENEIELQRRVDERTAELERKNDQLKQFSYAASHDLKEPLRKITYFLEKLVSNIGTSLTDDNKKITDRIQLTATRMNGLIDDLLNYSNTSLGTTGFKELDLTTIVKEVVDDMEASVIKNNAVIDVHPLPGIKGDQNQLRQLFQNLISNAVKYQKPGTAPHILIEAQSLREKEKETFNTLERRGRQFFKIIVKDNGIGFEQEYAEQIFGLFQRLHGKSEYEGTGVGLAIAQKVAENHHGYIEAESEPGEGATFTIYFPVTDLQSTT